MHARMLFVFVFSAELSTVATRSVVLQRTWMLGTAYSYMPHALAWPVPSVQAAFSSERGVCSSSISRVMWPPLAHELGLCIHSRPPICVKWAW